MKEEIKPMRISEWEGSPATPPPDRPSSATPPPRPPAPPGPGDPDPNSAAPGAKLPPTVWQGFDLLRLPLGIIRRWYLTISFAALGTALGIVGAIFLFHASAVVTVRLMVRNPQAFAISETSYSPAKLQTDTLIGAITAPQVARAVSKKMDLGLPPDVLRKMIEVSEVRRTEFVDLDFTTPWDAKKTREFAVTWAAEAIAFTRQLQSEESVEMKSYLEEQMRRNDLEIERVNARLESFSREKGVIDANREMESYLDSIARLNMSYETGRVDLEAYDFQLEKLRKEIRQHSPTFDDLKKAEIKLQELGEYYTEINPIYLEELDKVEALRRKVTEELKSTDLGAADFTGTFVGNALYLQIIDLESKRESLALQNEQVKKMLAEARLKLKELPAIALEMAPLLESAQAIRTARDVLLKRLQEVEVFEEVAPGYYKLFKEPTERDVIVSGTFKKIVILGVFGAFFFGGIGAVGAMGLEFLDATVRTNAEAAVLLGCPGTFTMPAPTEADPANLGQELWAATVGPISSSGRVHAFWQPCPADEIETFWATLIEQASAMQMRVLIVHLTGDLPQPIATLPRIAPREITTSRANEIYLCELPPDLTMDAVRKTVASLQSARSIHDEIWLHATGLVREPAAAIARASDRITLIVTLGAAVRDFWQTQKSLLAARAPLTGFIAMSRKP